MMVTSLSGDSRGRAGESPLAQPQERITAAAKNDLCDSRTRFTFARY